MGRKTATETLAAVYQAFLEQRTWKQAELARAVKVEVRALRTCLDDLVRAGMPLHPDDDPPHVYWSVPPSWFPGGVRFESKEALELLRQLLRAPRTTMRDQLVQQLILATPAAAAPGSLAASVIPSRASEEEAAWLGLVEDSAAHAVALHFHYYSASSGHFGWRHASVQRVDVAAPARFAAWCHQREKLCWFRVDGIASAKLDEREPYRSCDSAEVDRFVAESLDGFHQGESARSYAFFVRDPEARWVKGNLLEGMESKLVEGGIRVAVTTSGVLRLARYVVGLGGAARVETEELRALVVGLAEDVVEANGGVAAVRRVGRGRSR